MNKLANLCCMLIVCGVCLCETLKEFAEREPNLVELLDKVNNNDADPFILPYQKPTSITGERLIPCNTYKDCPHCPDNPRCCRKIWVFKFNLYRWCSCGAEYRANIWSLACS